MHFAAPILLVTLSPFGIQDPAPEGQEPAIESPEPARVVNPVRGWFDRHLLLLRRGTPIEADFEHTITSGGEPLTVRGKAALNGLTRYYIELIAEIEDPRTRAIGRNVNRFTADGEYLWMEARPPEPQLPSLKRFTLEKLATLKMLRRQMGQPTGPLDPLDMFFDYAVVERSFKFTAQGKSEWNGIPVYSFTGVVRSVAELQGEIREMFQAGARNAELIFDARTGLLLKYELKGPDRVYTRKQFKNVAYPDSIRSNTFRYDTPAGLTALDGDPEIDKELAPAMQPQQP